MRHSSRVDVISEKEELAAEENSLSIQEKSASEADSPVQGIHINQEGADSSSNEKHNYGRKGLGGVGSGHGSAELVSGDKGGSSGGSG